MLWWWFCEWARVDQVLTVMTHLFVINLTRPLRLSGSRAHRRAAPSWRNDTLTMVATSTLKTKSSDCVSEAAERRFGRVCIEKELDFWDHCLAEPQRSADVTEDRTCQQLAKMFENCLSRAKKTTLHCSSVLVPEKLTRRIAREVLRLAACEPCGLRGCVLYVHLELDKGCKRLERIVYDATVVPTFELTLVFKQDGTAWPSLRDVLFMGTCFAPKFRHVLKLSPGFRLIKKKLYSSSAGTVIEEC
uniref:DNA damage-inducible transcript 4-like protein n=2 Tax=Mastacembelus armatus TaxID=205130 RepID=A0A3Q3L7R9_9TELE